MATRTCSSRTLMVRATFRGSATTSATSATTPSFRIRRVITPRTLNSLRLTFNRSFRQFFPENYRTDVGRLWGVNWLNLPPRDFGFPQINVSGFSPVGDLTQLPIARHTNTYQLAESFSTTHGPHTLKAGGEIRHIRFAGTLDYFARGSLTFSGAITG